MYLRPYPFMALGTILCAILSTLCGFAFPKLTQQIIDKVILGRRMELLTPMMLALLGAFVMRDLFNSLRIRINNTFEQNVIYDLRRDVYARLQRLPVGYFDQRASGDLMTRVLEDVNSVERVLIDGTEQGSVALLTIVGVTVILLLTNPLLTAVALVPLPILAGSLPFLLVSAFLFGAATGGADVAMNTQASEIEKARGRPTMSSFHGFYSVGGLAGSSNIGTCGRTPSCARTTSACRPSRGRRSV